MPVVPELLLVVSGGAAVMSVAVAPPQAMTRPTAEITKGATRRMATTPEPLNYSHRPSLAMPEQHRASAKFAILPTLSPRAHRLSAMREIAC